MLEKLKNLLKKNGAAETARRLARFAYYAARMYRGPRRADRAALEALLGEIRTGKHERLVLRRGSFGWHTPLFQRAQQLARAMGRRGCLVLYEAAPPHEGLRGVQKLGEGLWLVNLRSPRLRRLIERAAAESGRPRYLMLASPESRLSPRLPERYAKTGWTVLYDHIDAISPEIAGGECRDAAEQGKQAILVENGVDCAHFFAPASLPEDARFRALLEEGRPIVGFYGALARWLDYAALRRLAADGRFTLLLIGVKYDGSFERELEGRENVVFLGAKPYASLPGYCSRCDVLLVPFRKGEVSDAASPVKLFEYMALGRPIVAGDAAECRRYRSVLIASAPEDYVRRVEQALALKDDAAYRETEKKEALAADWLRRAETLAAALRRRERT